MDNANRERGGYGPSFKLINVLEFTLKGYNLRVCLNYWCNMNQRNSRNYVQNISLTYILNRNRLDYEVPLRVYFTGRHDRKGSSSLLKEFCSSE